MFISTNFQELLARHFAPSVVERRDELERIANTDALTELPNRRAFDLAEAQAMRDGLAFIVFDANNFKKTNDRLGHAAGDKVLKQYARACSEVARNFKARAFRYGGDEFVIICAPRFAARVRDAVERLARPIDFGNFTVSFTGEIGATFKDADARLYARKARHKQGRL